MLVLSHVFTVTKIFFAGGESKFSRLAAPLGLKTYIQDISKFNT